MMLSSPPMDGRLTGSDYSQLRAFVAVGEALSFTRAAEALGVTPSALSQTVRNLEARVGVRLLNRTTRSVALTEAGANLLARVRPAVDELGAAVGQAGAMRDRPAGVVRLVTVHSAARLYVEPMLAEFARDFPDIVLDVTLDDAVVDIVAGGFDVAIRIGEVIERDLVAAPLGPELRQIAVASPDYLRRHGAPAHPRELVDHACIRWRWPGQVTPYNWEFLENSAWFEVAVSGPLITSDKTVALRAAIAGVGVAFTVEEPAREAIADGRLMPLLKEWAGAFPGHHLCYPQQRQMAPALRAFIDALRESARRQASASP